jgi:tetratricopeptide (TPR) repeat protein
MAALLARLTPEQQQDPKVVAAKFNWYYHQIGDAKAYVELSDRQGTDINFSDADSSMQYAEALCVLGQRDRAVALVRPWLDQLKAKLAANPDDSRTLSTLSYAQALVGDHDGAMATIARLLTALPGYPLRLQYFVHANAGIVYGWIGEKDKAVDQLLPLMSIPVQATSSVIGLHEDIDFSPLRGFPRWEALIADPANKRPFTY